VHANLLCSKNISERVSRSTRLWECPHLETMRPEKTLSPETFCEWRYLVLHRHGAPERNAFLRPSRVQIRAPKVGDCCSVGMSYVPARRARRLTPALDTRESRDATRRAWQSVVRIPLPFAPSWSYKQSTPSHASVYRCHQLFLALSVTIPAI
jgi:hypothetical protein